MDRVLGVETEYGLSARMNGRRLSAPEAAELLFRPLIAEHRTGNVFLGNGGRLYLDVGAHPEYATPECRTPHELLVAERAGDELVADLAERAAAMSAEHVVFRVLKNNVDSFGNSYGCHENYLVSRELDLKEAADLLTTFLVTRQVLCGAGRHRAGEFLISQRADHLHAGLSALTTRARPLVNTRDEPLADATRFRRLHVLAGDSNLAEPSALLKVGTAVAMLELLDDRGMRAQLAGLRLSDPAKAIRQVSRDPFGSLDLADGRVRSAIDLQREYLGLAGPFAEPQVAALWARVTEALATGKLEEVSDKVEWLAKRRLIDAFRQRHHLSPADPRLDQLDLAFHELGGPFASLEAGGAVARLTDPDQVRRARTEAPADTRASARSAFLAAVGDHRYSVDWQTCIVHGDPEQKVVLSDPLASRTAELDHLLDSLAN